MARERRLLRRRDVSLDLVEVGDLLILDTVFARQEVVPSAEALISPNLLLLSGVGPRAGLK
jgi:choline dehydrogenase-like flavoprotein